MQDAATATETKILILTPAQAEAVYSAMCALNNVSGAQLQTVIPATTGAVRVREMPSGTIAIEYLLRSQAPDGLWLETYDNQSAFATAYGLQQG